MLNQLPLELLRFIIVFILQGSLIIVFIWLALRILMRKRDRTKLALALFYVFIIIGLFFNILFLSVASTGNDILIIITYILTSYFIFFPFIYIVIFLNTLLKLEDEFTLKKIILIVLLYGICTGLLYLIPDGITFTAQWTPIFNPVFGIMVAIFFTLSITLPTIIYSYRLYKIFKAPNLRKKLRIFLIGVILIYFAIYGALFFNTITITSIKSIYALIAITVELIAGILFYIGFGRDL